MNSVRATIYKWSVDDGKGEASRGHLVDSVLKTVEHRALSSGAISSEIEEEVRRIEEEGGLKFRSI